MTIASNEELVKAGRCTDLAAAAKWNESRRNTALNNAMSGKSGDRPWAIVDMTKFLPKDEAWFGFEYEHGFDDEGVYREAVAYLWDNFNYVAMDREGSGAFPVEVAFGPVPYSTIIEKREAPIQKYLKWLAEKGYKQANNPTTFSRTLIGMHINISTPKLRAGRADAGWSGPAYTAGDRIRRLLDALPERQQLELFGRAQSRFSKCSSRGRYFEFKLFGSTDDVAKFDGYVTLSGRLASLIDFCLETQADPTNLYEFLSGKDKKLIHIPDSSAKVKANVRARRI